MKTGLTMTLSGFVLACGMSSESPDQLLSRHQTGLAEARTAVQNHGRDVVASMDDHMVMQMEQTHLTNMNDVMARMDQTLEQMSKCGDLTTDADRGEMTSLHNETQKHSTNMAGATTIEQMKAEEARYDGQMNEQLAQMDTRHASMMGMMTMMGSDMMCE